MKPFLRKILKYLAITTWIVTVFSAIALFFVYILEYLKNFRLTAKKAFGVIKALLEL